ncbi:DUF4838 domain-containing protein [bacterium]|nr:DUF4838 domain-containing protein [bacterium]
MKRILLALFVIGVARGEPIELVKDGKSSAYILVRAEAGRWERQAAQDLAIVVRKMTGASLPVVNRQQEGFPIVVGDLARPRLAEQLERVIPKQPVLRSDAIALAVDSQGLYLAGSNDDSHYFAVAELMRRWGCRWYLPTDLGECIPQQTSLSLEPFSYSYAPPFEVRGYWISWNGDRTGYEEFAHRNFMNNASVPAGHAIGTYVKEVQKKLGRFEVSSPAAAEALADLIGPDYSTGKSLSLSIEDGEVSSATESDRELSGHLFDKYFQTEALADSYLLFYNRVCQRLHQLFPDSQARLGFLAYINLTLPPQRKIEADRALVAYLAAIDTDPNHAFTDAQWSSRADYWGALRGWVKAMHGRVIIYDYDQSMLVWRDLPNPSHQVLSREIKEYARLGLLGFSTESRNAIATTFLNLYFRGQLYWNPDLDVANELKLFYPKFFGPAATPMENYWSAIYKVWNDTQVTEHEYFVIPAIYTRELSQNLATQLAQAGQVSQEPYHSRLEFVRSSWSILDGVTRMQERVGLGDYAGATLIGRETLAFREELTKQSGIFTTYKSFPESGPAFWPGEVDYFEEMARLAQRKIRQSPILWGFRADPEDHGIWQGWAGQSQGWGSIRTDLYLQAQRPETRPGYAWYRWDVELEPAQLQGVHLLFPGLFNESWLYLNGHLQAHRPQKELWWRNDYRFLWDVPLQDLHSGRNSLVVRTKVPLHFAGIFRPPFLYRP